jgi:ParB family chromosome partitioning protein
MSSKGKINFKSGLASLTQMSESQASARFDGADRFEQAAAIVAQRPTGLAPAVPSADVKPSSTGRSALTAPQVGDILMLPIDSVRDNPRNARKLYSAEKIKERAASLAKNGQMQPAVACLDWENPGRYILIAGHYRKKGLLLLGRTEIQVKIVEARNHLDLWRLSFDENDQREQPTPLDHALAWRELLESGDIKTQDEIAEHVNVSRVNVTKTLRILTLPDSVLDIMRESPDKFGLAASYELTQIAQLTQLRHLEEIARKVAAETLSTRELAHLRDGLASPAPTRKTKEISRQHKILADGQQIGYIKDWDSGRVMLEVTIDDPVTREQFLDELKKRFGLNPEALPLTMK